MSFSRQQESLQGALGASHEDDDWLPIPRRHSYQKRFNHQEQICCLRNALCASFIYLSYLLLVRMFTLLQRLCGMQSGRQTLIQDYMPNVSITCPGLEPQGEKKTWKADEHESSKTLTMRGINSG